MTTWRQLIQVEMNKREESFGDVVSCTLDHDGLDREFNDGYGGQEGFPFTLWTHFRVYFPTCYDGSEWVSSAPRAPCSEEMSHVGGG